MATPKHALRDAILVTVGIVVTVVGLFLIGLHYGVPYFQRQQDKRSVERQFEREVYYQELLHEHYLKTKKGCST